MKIITLSRSYALVLFLVAVLAAPLYAQTGSPGSTAVAVVVVDPDAGDLRTFIELARSDIKTQKAVILAQNMDFTADEAVDFWISEHATTPA